MNPILAFFIKSFVSIPTTMMIWLVSYFSYDQSFLLSSGLAIAGGGLMFGVLSVYFNHSFLSKHRITRKEYKYIKSNLKEAKPKLSRLNKSLLSIHHIPSVKQRIDLYRVTQRIYKLAKNEPRRFYLAEQFFFSHLDSVVELSEKYAFLAAQPRKNKELEQSLRETRHVLDEMTRTIEEDLHKMLSNDINELHFEIDVAKKTNKDINDTKFIDDNRR